MVLANEYCGQHPEIMEIVFISDSSATITNITRLNAHPSQRLSRIFVKNAETFLKHESHKITIKWAKGHRGTAINEEADKLAKLGRRKPQNHLSPLLLYYAEKQSHLTLTQWRKDFDSNRPTGAFGEVTFHPPTTKPDRTFLQLANDPEVFGRLTQVRTMHGYNPPYYHRFHIDHDLECTCGNYFNPANVAFHRRHILNNCDEYADHHHLLSHASQTRDPTILLGSTKGLLAVAKFLKASGAFTADGRPYHPPHPPEVPELELHLPPEPD